MLNLHMRRLHTRNNTQPPQTLNVLVRHELCVLQARADGRDIRVRKGCFEGIEDEAVGAVADGVDVLEVKSACCPIFFERRPG